MFAVVRPGYCHGSCQLDPLATRAIRASVALDISVRMDTYSYVLPDKRAEAAKKIEEIYSYQVAYTSATRGPGEYLALFVRYYSRGL